MSYQDNPVCSLNLGHHNGRSALHYKARGGGTSNTGLLCAIRSLPLLYSAFARLNGPEETPPTIHSRTSMICMQPQD
jgi:hypothetical protein